MALIKTVDPVLTAERGETSYNYRHVPDDPEHPGGILLTGRHIAGVVRLSDGTVYDVTPEVIEHAEGHHGPLLHHIDKMHEAAGRLTHVCSDLCGAEAAI